MEELRGFTLANLYERIGWNDDTFIEWLQNMSLLHKDRKCECGGKTSLKTAKEGRGYPRWRCTTKKCRKEVGFLAGTFFEGMHLSLLNFTQN